MRRKGRVIVDNQVAILRMLSSDVIPLMTPSQLLTHYLVASYGYYILAENVMEDVDYDVLCKRLLGVFDTFDHPHKHLTNKERLQEGTCYHLRMEEYPPQVRHGISTYVRNLNNGNLEHGIRRIHEIGEAAWLQEVDEAHRRNNPV